MFDAVKGDLMRVTSAGKTNILNCQSSLHTVISQTTIFTLASGILQTRSVVYGDNIDTKNSVIGCAARR